KAKAGELMKTAYEKTGESSFQTQRRDFLPAPPEVDLTAGYYDSKKYIAITSFQGYDVYYTFDESAELPAGGSLFTERVFLDEGIHTLRAVAVNGELVSDELHGTYRIIMPSPQTPRSSLAPATYKTRQRVRLKPGLDNENDDDIVIYYTIDGSSPDADSPIYTGEAFWLPGGWVTVKAVAVNKYNKVSNMLETLYKIQIPEPLRGYNSEQDAPKNFTLYVTKMIEFQQAFGEGTLAGETTIENLDTECRKYDYPWGYAVMSRTNSGWVLAEVYTTEEAPFQGPGEPG
ncbi:MAG: chitobiase/beta-hexosaminidase C-terminal domain-containing protein, partial [Clostridia bacterium]|nr:chitobiase/beta-hexosaminidase C-terminal domain-containing protein [Clostridia bacterium]